MKVSTAAKSETVGREGTSFCVCKGSVWQNAEKQDFTPSFPVWSSKRETNPDVGQTSSPGQRSNWTSRGEQKLDYFGQLKAFP